MVHRMVVVAAMASALLLMLGGTALACTRHVVSGMAVPAADLLAAPGLPLAA